MSLGGELAEPARVAEVAAAAESAGWDGIFVWDHLWHGEPFADPWITLAAIALATETVRIGPLVTPLPRRRVQVVAQQAATLDRLCGGRLTLGFGLGSDKRGEYSAFDEPLTDARERAAFLDSGLEFLIPALSGETVSSAGDRRTTIDCVQEPRPPIWVGGRAGLSAGPRRAARHGLEGVALVGRSEWAPDDVAAALKAGSFEAGAIDIALVGGDFPKPDELAAAGATWLIPELVPGTSFEHALDRASERLR